MKTETQRDNSFISSYHFDKCPEELRQHNLEIGKVYVCKDYFDEILSTLGREPDWIREDAIAHIYPEDLYKMFEKWERPFEQKGLTKVQWWFGFQYLGEKMVGGERHLKIRRLFGKRQDYDNSCDYFQAKIEDIRNGVAKGLYAGGAENWSKYRDKAVFI